MRFIIMQHNILISFNLFNLFEQPFWGYIKLIFEFSKTGSRMMQIIDGILENILG